MVSIKMDGFDRLPDSLILQIFNSVSDIKTLIRCRTVCKRFNSLVPQSESLVLKVDCVISSDSGDGGDSFLVSFLKSIIKSLHDLVSPKTLTPPLLLLPTNPSQSSPAQILRGFDRVRRLQIELPSGDLRLEKGAVVRWRAEFGKALRSCVILGFRSIRQSPQRIAASSSSSSGEVDLAGGLKMRVVWTISALIAASARHYLLKEAVREHRGLERLVLRDREGEGTLVMSESGLKEWWSETNSEEDEEEEEEEGDEEEGRWERNRTRVPSVRMRMRHEPRVVELSDGVWAEGATLVVVRPSNCGIFKNNGVEVVENENEIEVGDVDEEVREDAELAREAFGCGGVYGEAVQALLKGRSYVLEMNSF